MSDNDPFAEPDDNERTVIRPNPGGRRPASAPAAPAYQAPPPPAAAYPDPPRAQAAPAAAAAGAAAPAIAATGLNPLNGQATTLFSLISRIRNRAQHLDPEKLRANVVAEVRGFEGRCLTAGIDPQNVKVARYAICATIDDVVLNTPWGEASSWAQQSMVATFHRETVGGDRFYDLLARLEQDPARNIDLLEFLYMCLSLGFEGRLRVEHGGSDKHLTIRQGLARIIRGQRGEVEADLSPHWKGLEKPHRPLSVWTPVWIASACFAVLLGAIYATLAWALTSSANAAIDQLAVYETQPLPTFLRQAPPPPDPKPTVADVKMLDGLQTFLQPEVDAGRVTLLQDTSTITIRIAGAGMFGSGSDALKPEFDELLTRVADALNSVTGPVLIAGHSDSDKIRTSRFPSNMHLSLARAEAVQKFLAAKLTDPARLTAEGRADKEPIADNATREGKAANRRIEIVLRRIES
ncbi:type VI secretion system protein TssL, long form [Paragemmobacter straminiformis]|uniref:Type VI secretion system protein TssL n=1 Tax=Paragemmobacter straminiformis TaxID=2045119 RepID=A0A842IA10_9RHOB|nr:type VI secretion system protein TssL, long form [Gemmobacter straminiformis]MBC2836449.1 type VI secretion system protein TssL [Gemmobacter straminiformis]